MTGRHKVLTSRRHRGSGLLNRAAWGALWVAGAIVAPLTAMAQGPAFPGPGPQERQSLAPHHFDLPESRGQGPQPGYLAPPEMPVPLAPSAGPYESRQFESREFGPPQRQAAPPRQAAPRQQGRPIQLTQSLAAPTRPLPPEIAAMPQAQEELEVIRRRSQLVVTRKRIVQTAIADPSVIDVVQYSPTEISIVGLELGSTNLLLWFEDDPTPLIYEITVIRDPNLEDQKRIDYGRLERQLAILFPDSKVYLIPLSGKIIVKGQARDAEEAARILQLIRGEVINQEGRLGGPQQNNFNNNGRFDNFFTNDLALDRFSSLIVNMLEVPGEYQVMLRVRIAELSRSQLRQMGVDLNVLLNDGRHAITSIAGGAASTLTGIFENGEINVLVNWLESNGTAKILSEPTLTVLSGHAASFLSGAEFAVPTIVGLGGAQAQQTSFRGFGTSIIVTPTVIDRDLIRMRIVPEFSEANQGLAVGGIPGLNSRRVQTTIELREGQTIAIAGLISSQQNTEITRIPFLGEIPYIGAKLFTAKRATLDETELLVLVTPEIVRPMDADEVPPVPGYEVTFPNQWELYHAGMSEGVPDTSYYQVPPLGSDSNHGINVPFRLHNPAPAGAIYQPVPTGTYGGNPETTMPPGQGAAPMAPPTGYPAQSGYQAPTGNRGQVSQTQYAPRYSRR